MRSSADSDSDSRRPNNMTDHTLARLTKVSLLLLVEPLKLHIFQSKIIAKLVYPACTKCCKTGITRLPAGFTHIWYRPTAHILGHFETI
jgi:hypothetical protein